MRRHWTGLRGLFALSATILLVVTLVSLLVLLGTAAVFQRSMETVSRDTRSAAIAQEMEAAALLYQRLANLHQVSADPGLEDEKAEVAAQLARLSTEAAGFVGPGEERALLERVAATLARYLQERNRLDASGAELEDIIRQTSPVLSAALADLDSLRALNDQQVQTAHRDARQAQRLSGLFGLLAAMLLIVGLMGLALLVRRRLFLPVVGLFEAMAAFRGGDLAARGRVEGARELVELTSMFNDMAETVARQRQAQLAFLAGVAHDLKNPLATLKNGLYLMALDDSPDSRSRRRGTLDHQLDQLSLMIDDVMDAGRIEAGALELRCREFDLCRLIGTLVESYGAVAPEHHLVSRLPGNPLHLVADPLRVEQVLRNLISNAIKYSPGGAVEVSACRDGALVQISVRDHGVGIPPEEIADIFLPFRRRRLNVAPGVGLGLSVVRRIVDAHGGSIEVDSRVDAGSTFTVTLPAAGPPTARPTRLRTEPAPGGAMPVN